MNGKVLVADDDVDNRTIAREVLEATGLTVVLATNGVEALDAASKQMFDVIVLDLSMPKLSGWETAKQLRQLELMDGVPILAFTAHALVGDDIKAKMSGCDDYISKPCIPSELAKKIGLWLEIKKRRDEQAAA